MENDRFFSLIKLKGVSQTHLCSLVGRTRHYLQDVKAGKSTPPESFVRIWANALDTSYEYLMGEDEPAPEIQTDSAFRVGKSRFTHSLGTMNLAGEIAEQAEAMELYGKLTADDKKTVLDLMRRLAGE